MNSFKTRDHPRKFTLAVFLASGLVVGALAGSAVQAETVGSCYVAEIPQKIELPDGSIHQPGQLKVCYTAQFSPVAGLHRTLVDGRQVGQFVSRRASSDTPEALEEKRPYFVFKRSGEETLMLVGYALPERDGLRTYDLGGMEQTISKQLARQLDTNDGNDGWILIAASDR